MNLLDAIKSGKPYKRPSWVEYYQFKNTDTQREVFSKNDLLAEDYQIQEQKLELSWEQIKGAVIYTMACDADPETIDFKVMKKRLGFE